MEKPWLSPPARLSCSAAFHVPSSLGEKRLPLLDDGKAPALGLLS